MYTGLRQKEADLSYSKYRRHKRKNPLIRELNIIYYIDNMGCTLMGWQPRVILLNRLVKDLTEELKDIYKYRKPGLNLKLIMKLSERDIDYVTDNEYINCIKFILERWHPELMEKKYIRYVYEGLALRNEKFVNDMGYSTDNERPRGIQHDSNHYELKE